MFRAFSKGGCRDLCTHQDHMQAIPNRTLAEAGLGFLSVFPRPTPGKVSLLRVIMLSLIRNSHLELGDGDTQAWQDRFRV